MYGYIRPERGDLRVRELLGFRSVYCGLCESLRRRYGPVARLLVNYDLTFLGMLLSRDDGCETMRRCPVHPLRKRACLCGESALDTAADYSVILAYGKLGDDLSDEPLFRRLPMQLAKPLLRRWYRRAAEARPAFAETVQAALKQLWELERSGDATLDAAADCTARMLAAAAQEAAQEPCRRALSQLLYHMGRSIYILDAVDDLKADVARGRYNPLRTRFSLESDILDGEAQQTLRGTLNLSQRSMAAAAALLPESPWSGIVENVVTQGLPAVTEQVFSGQWHKKKRKAEDALV